MGEVGTEGLMQVLEDATVLLATGGHGRPDALAPASSAFATCALGHMAVLDHEADGLLGQVVRRLQARRGKGEGLVEGTMESRCR